MLSDEQKKRREEFLARAAAAKNGEPDPVAAEPALEEVAETFDPPQYVPGIVAEPEAEAEAEIVEEIAEEIADEPFERFLAALDVQTRSLLDDDELREVFEAQRAKAQAERKAVARKAAMDRALTEARIAEGVLPKETADHVRWRERMSEIVPFTVDLPEMGDIGIRVDQKVYLHGVTYQVTRAEAESMRSVVYQAQQNELLFEGKDRRHWLRRRARGGVDGHIGSF
jgi:hypothetical protein